MSLGKGKLGGRFRVDSEIARGGMGVVYAVVDESSGERVALKRLQPAASVRFGHLFEREFQVLASLQHPRIIRVYEYGVDDQGAFYTMELLDGSDLRAVAPVPVREACGYLRDVASSLSLLHARRLVHRDVSPSNVRVSPDGRCKLIDFGALSHFGATDDIAGTPPSIPPEALFGQSLDQRADLYALGALAYWILTGRHAYPARRVAELGAAWMSPPAPPSAFAAGISPELDALVLSLLCLDVLGRPASASEVIERLEVIGELDREHDGRAADAFLVSTVLVERGPELERVTRRLQKTSQGAGSSIFVDSGPGVGRSRYLREAALAAQLAGLTVVSVDAGRSSAGASTAALLLERLLRVAPDATAAALGADAPALAAALGDSVPALAALVPRAEVSGETGKGETVPEIVARVLVEVARVQRLLVAVDDVDRAEPEALALLLRLVRATRDVPLVVVVTASSEGELPPGARALRESSAAIRLRELSEPAVLELVRSVFGAVPHAGRTAKRLHSATGGNPGHCLALMQHWVTSGLVYYVGGAWVLPLDVGGVLPGAEAILEGRLQRCSDDARAIAEVLVVLDRPTSPTLCAEVSGVSRADVMDRIAELSAAEIVASGSDGFGVRYEALRRALYSKIPDERRRAFHARIGEVLLASATTHLQTMIAGSHFVRAGEGPRGADVIAGAARRRLSEPGDLADFFATVVPELEAALDVRRAQGSRNTALLPLLVPLVLASAIVSPALADRYGQETLSRLYRALGFPEDPADVTEAALFSAFGAAPVLEDGEERTPETPDLVMLVTWLVACTIGLVGVKAATIDHAGEEAYARYLAPFQPLGSGHPTVFAWEYCRHITEMTEDRMSAAHAGWTDALARLETIPFPPDVARRIRLGALYSLGVLECQRDDDVALARMDQIEAEGGSDAIARVYASQLRFLFHGFRGEIELAERHRERVEAYAVQRGTAWQVEVWSTCTLSGVYGSTRDGGGNRRVTEELRRLSEAMPALSLYYRRAQATQALLTGNPERAIALYEQTLAESAPRQRIGWGAVRGALARAYNVLGSHEKARAIAAETIALSAEDRDYVSMNLGMYIELGEALTGLGRAEEARTVVDELLERHESRKNPMTLGSIHQLGVHVAELEGNEAALSHHLREMERWFRSTKNPALIGQFEAIRARRNETTGDAVAVVREGISTFAGSTSTAKSILGDCRGPLERKQRALQLVASRANAAEAWLFTIGERGEPVEAGSLAGAEPPEELRGEVERLFAQYLVEAEATNYVDPSAPGGYSGVVSSSRFRLYALTVPNQDEILLIGAIAIRVNGVTRLVSHGIVRQIAAQLHGAGDFRTARLAG